MSNKNINTALGDNAKFYPNYLTNHVASDFKFHLDNGIGRILDENKKLKDALSDVVDGHSKYDLVESTGLSVDRCEEIIELIK